MKTLRAKIKDKIKRAKHLSKPDKADLVCRDKHGRWIFEVYGDLKFDKK